MALTLLAGCTGDSQEPATEGGDAGTTTSPVAADGTATASAGSGSLASGTVPQTVTIDERPSVLDYVDHPPPIASLITVGTPDAEQMVAVSGAAGAVASDALVGVTSLGYAIPDFVRASEDGSFDAKVLAAPGEMIQIRYRVEGGFDSSIPGGVGAINHWPGTLVRAPQTGAHAAFRGLHLSLRRSRGHAGFRLRRRLRDDAWGGRADPRHR